jgi:3-mercaptopyruvate sulfurtransferase SseA
LDYAQVERGPEVLPLERDIVFYCTCPNDSGAAYAARKLIDLGYTRVRPLLGGLDAWIAAGYEVELASDTSADPASTFNSSESPTNSRFSASSTGRSMSIRMEQSVDEVLNTRS